MEQKRGQLTDSIKSKSKELLGYEIDVTELRLMAHIQYVMVNDQKINPELVNLDEMGIIFKWSTLGLLSGNEEKLNITKKFWDIICEIIFLGYVEIKKD